MEANLRSSRNKIKFHCDAQIMKRRFARQVMPNRRAGQRRSGDAT
jgi:hypothetical protein